MPRVSTLPPILKTLALAVLPATVGAWMAASCSSGSSSGCSTSADCERYLACVDGACAAKPCSFAADCTSDEVCATAPDGNQVCTAQECGCPGCDPCGDGTECTGGLCLEPGTAPSTGACVGNDCLDKACLKDDDCGGLVCVSGVCKPQAPSTGCTSDADCPDGTCNTATGECVAAADAGGCSPPCPEGMICNLSTGQCEGGADGGSTQPTGGLCASCAGDADCENGECIALGGGSYCLPVCDVNGDCPTGYQCFDLPTQGKHCVPESYACEKDCIQHPDKCAPGQACNFDTGECIAKLKPCDTCTKDYQCGDGNRCALFAPQDRRCMPTCASVGGQCPEGSTCQELDGTKVCVPVSDQQCCYGESCGGSTTNCEPPTPFVYQGQCVECLNSTHCGTGSCDTTTHTCTGGQQQCNCPPDKVCQPQTGACVDCVNSTQCGQGQICDPATNTCTSDVCAACAPPYPACTEISGQMTCVQCTQDSDCPDGQCNETTFLCEGNSVNPCQQTGNCCKSDADCPPSTQFTLKCDVATGLCYDVNGGCDNITAFCDASSGSECVSIFDLLGGGLGGGGGSIPSLPGMPTGAFGFCTCSLLPPELCQLPGIPGCSDKPGKCFGGLSCSPFGALLSLLGASGGGNQQFNSTSFCQGSGGIFGP